MNEAPAIPRYSQSPNLGKLEEENDNGDYDSKADNMGLIDSSTDNNSFYQSNLNTSANSDELSNEVKQLKHFIQSEFSYIFSQYMMTIGGAGGTVPCVYRQFSSE
jgi:RNA recognition motif-containing protein